mmetsp:Transcript_22293/g.62154  ORF Transcript_22293/g.62154 Transcript_22293/m.62154 type:complete len:214 (+) Transcript_22293:1420-2061(+)
MCWADTAEHIAQVANSSTIHRTATDCKGKWTPPYAPYRWLKMLRTWSSGGQRAGWIRCFDCPCFCCLWRLWCVCCNHSVWMADNRCIVSSSSWMLQFRLWKPMLSDWQGRTKCTSRVDHRLASKFDTGRSHAQTPLQQGAASRMILMRCLRSERLPSVAAAMPCAVGSTVTKETRSSRRTARVPKGSRSRFVGALLRSFVDRQRTTRMQRRWE